MKRSSILFIAIFLLAACQPMPTAIPEVPSTEIPSTEVIPTLPQTEVVPIQASATPQEIAMPENLKISSKDGMTQIWIPGGTFIMGGMDVYRENDEQPPHEVFISAFWMDQVEVTNGMYNLCVQSGACRPPEKIRSDNREEYFGQLEFQDYPVVYVTWTDATAYCQWAGRRLPTEAEWERAARGDDKRNYPWGDELPNEYNSNSNNLVGDTSRVGSYAEGASPFGILDMAGNVWEWVADRYRQDYYEKSPAEDPQGPTAEEVFNNLRVIRGGSFQEDGRFARVNNRNTLEGPDPKSQPDDPKFYGESSYKVGFRCVAGN
ncbi:MAG TPA: SUMF1/EgtB/PvdO family nonheme iron enzyme [Anaerolineales bacterium]|nr:SUMF1/EgtB/PvdO family nonheme iron enzyme [Anaerolineales bacterium]HNN13433.1 SUMF1/EgtB/PvdO family nonheme iron enzyme [Anaerolineales bacterium]